MSVPSSAKPSDPAPVDAFGSISTRLMTAALVAVALVAILAWLFLAGSHLQDRYGVLHVQGAWMGLAQYANEGIVYPPLFDGEQYGGTRWMPLPILLNATAARITGEYLVSGKLVGLVLTAVLLVLVFFTLRRLEAPRALSAALAGTIIATDPGRIAGTTLGGDVLPVVLQVGSLVVATSGGRSTRCWWRGHWQGLRLPARRQASGRRWRSSPGSGWIDGGVTWRSSAAPSAPLRSWFWEPSS